MTLLEASLLLATGVLAGVAGGLLGIGGCSIMLPVLVFIYGYPEAIAIGTTITAVILTAFSGACAHLRMGNVDRATALIIGVSGSVGAAVGDVLFDALSSNIGGLDMVLGAAFIYIALRMVWEGLVGLRLGGRSGSGGDAAGVSSTVPGTWIPKACIGFLVGVVSGLVGLGGGYALVPALVYLLGSPVKIAVGTSLAGFLPLALVSAAPKLAAGKASVYAAVLLGLGTLSGAQVGARVVPRAPAWLIKLLFGALFVTVSVKFLVKGIMVYLG